jgi:hypothetical protein
MPRPQRGRHHSAASGLLEPPIPLIGFAEADDCPDDTAAPALMEYAEGCQPLLAGKAKKIADELGAQIDVWWKNNASDVITLGDWHLNAGGRGSASRLGRCRHPG